EAVIDISRLNDLRLPRMSRRTIAQLAIAAACLILLVSALYQVGPDEIGAVQRFGRYARSAGPGLGLKFPLIESVTKVPVQRQLRQEFGFRTASDPKMATTKFGAESTMLTGDLNVAVVEWIVQYRIADPYRYLFRVRDVDGIFRDLTQAVMESAIG